MKIAITGHTTGIGKAIFEKLEAEGHIVLGMSRTTGYHLPEDGDRVLHDSKDCDIFINLWHERNTDFQIQLLYDFFLMWKGQNKHIISIGSRAGECYILGNVDKYAMFKAAHDAACEQLFNRRNQQPRVTNIRPGWVDTESNVGVNEPMLTPEQVADAVMYTINADFYVSQITLACQKTG